MSRPSVHRLSVKMAPMPYFHDGVFTWLAIFSTCIVVDVCTASASERPTLLLAQTDEVFFMCNMTGVIHSLTADSIVDAMQIGLVMPGSDQKTELFQVLATLTTHGEAKPSLLLHNSGKEFRLTGAEPETVSEWWLKLVFVGVKLAAENGTTEYRCKVSYSERNQTVPSSWKSPVIKYVPETYASVDTPGFALSVTKGLDMLCVYAIPANQVNTTKIEFKAITPNATTNNLAVWYLGNEGFSPARVLRHPRTAVPPTYFSVMSARLLYPTCNDQGLYQCSVISLQGETLTSDQQHFKLSRCTHQTPSTFDRLLSAKIVGGLVLFVIVVIVITCAILYCFRRKNQGSYRMQDNFEFNNKNRNDNRWPDQGWSVLPNEARDLPPQNVHGNLQAADDNFPAHIAPSTLRVDVETRPRNARPSGQFEQGADPTVPMYAIRVDPCE